MRAVLIFSSHSWQESERAHFPKCQSILVSKNLFKVSVFHLLLTYFNLLNHQLQVDLCPLSVCEDRWKPDRTVLLIISGHFLTKNVLYEETTNESGCFFNRRKIKRFFTTTNLSLVLKVLNSSGFK